MNEHQVSAIRALNRMKTEIEEAIEWVTQQADEEEALNPQPPSQPTLVPYDSFFRALCKGCEHQAILIRAGYTFDPSHTVVDVEPYQLPCCSPVSLQLTTLDDQTCGFEDIEFKNISGEVAGCVILNEAALLIWIDCTVQCNGGNLTIFAKK